MLHMFKNLIKLITGYDSEVWDYNKTTQSEIDKAFPKMQDLQSNQQLGIV